MYGSAAAPQASNSVWPAISRISARRISADFSRTPCAQMPRYLRPGVSLQDLSAKIMDGTVAIDGRRLARESDEEIVARLTTVRGIGKWSAEIFLMFQLRRLDVWPTGDLGVRKGYALAWAIPAPTPKQLDILGEPYRPYRSVVAWYCWRAVQIYAGAARSAVTA